jgi:hypothetical protein
MIFELNKNVMKYNQIVLFILLVQNKMLRLFLLLLQVFKVQCVHANF